MTQMFKKLRSMTAVRATVKASIAAASIVTVSWSEPARAEEETRAADVAAARELAIEGLKLADAGQCEQAIDKLARAEKLYHAPIVLGRLGECEVSVGKIVDGTENLRKLLREPLPSNPPAALTKARERAQAVLDAAKPKIASVTISVREPAENATVMVDGQLVPPALFDRSRPTDPGEHLVEASAPGYLKSTRQLSLAPGEKQDISFRLAPDPQAAAAAREAQASPTAQSTAAHQEPGTQQVAAPAGQPSGANPVAGPNYTPSYVLWSVGGVAVAAGGVFGYVALKDKQDLDKQCVNGSCPSASRDQLDSAKREALISTVLFGAGGAALAIGSVVYLLSGPSMEQPNQSAHVGVRPNIGLGHVGLEGTF